MALNATVGGTSSNSYVTQAEATAYFAGRLDVTTWTSASSNDKDAALMMATARLDAETYTGSRVFTDQRLHWPRYSTFDRDGIVLDHTTIPLVIQQATFEFALALLREPTLLGDTGLEWFENVKIGSLDVTPRSITSARLPAFVKQLIAPVRKGGMGTPVQRA